MADLTRKMADPSVVCLKHDEWSQIDPLTTKRLASVKKLAYYVQSQLQQASKALDLQWNDLAARDPKLNPPGQRMLRPILDDVYQPLVKQQEILSRQQAVLRSLRNTLDECESSPMIKCGGLLRSTPFKKDPLSKLTKNILNMSLEAERKKTIENEKLTAQKLDALRDMLSNRKTVKIKPVNFELTQHLEAMRLSYQKSVKEKSKLNESAEVKVEPKVETQQWKPQTSQYAPQVEQKPALSQEKQMPLSFGASPVTNVKPTPTAGFGNVARTLFTDEPKQEQPQTQTQPKPQPAQSVKQPITSTPAIQKSISFSASSAKETTAFGAPGTKTSTAVPAFGSSTEKPTAFGAPKETTPFAAPTAKTDASVEKPTSTAQSSPPVSDITRSALKDLLQNKSQLTMTRSENNLFMGQKICSPTAFAASTPLATSQATSNVPTSKPTSEIAKLLTQPRQPLFGTQDPNKTQNAAAIKPESVKTEAVKETKPAVSFAFKPTPLAGNGQNVPDLVKSQSQGAFSFGKIDGITKLEPKPAEKVAEKVKENVPEQPKSVEVSKAAEVEKKENSAPKFGIPEQTVKPISFGAPSQPLQSVTSATPVEVKTEPKPTETKADSAKEPEKPASDVKPSSAASIFASKAIRGIWIGHFYLSAFSLRNPLVTHVHHSQFDKTLTIQPYYHFFPKPISLWYFCRNNNKFSCIKHFRFCCSIFCITVFIICQTDHHYHSKFRLWFFHYASFYRTCSSYLPINPVFSIWGSNHSSTTTQASVFGSASPSSIFAAAAKSTSSSVFGSTTVTTQSAFGASPTAAPASIFSSASTGQSIFAAAATTQASVFGSPTTTTQSLFGGSATTQSSLFGSPTATTQASVFGSPTATTQAQSGGSLFGDNLFAAASISTTTAAAQPTGSIFGGGSPGFGSSSPSNVFASKSTFGQASPAAAIFGGAAQAQAFQKPATNLWGGASSGGGFGGSAFGQQTTQASSVFGTGSFSGGSPGQAFAPAQPAAFGQTQPASPGAFGGSPSFGAKPAFGQSASFGSPTPGFGQPAFRGFNKSPGGGFPLD
ncbi:hypothetical protein JYU34_012951 [Plutella xylostella]|uniref:Nuclear pore complex protein Nup214 n=1 Tax=Plutella xylostella TaxID=51655 RepID=A0ABQ7QCN0_PLUXY|nr:hypothetical protein JYU34_012951 [Plutella xylostella]